MLMWWVLSQISVTIYVTHVTQISKQLIWCNDTKSNSYFKVDCFETSKKTGESNKKQTKMNEFGII